MNEYTKIIYLMGTKISLYLKAENAEKLAKKAEDMLINYEKAFSANSDSSQLAILKKTASLAPQKVDEELYNLIKIGKKHSLYVFKYCNRSINKIMENRL